MSKEYDLGQIEGRFDIVYISVKDWNEMQKQLKALEIIKNKRVDIDLFYTVMEDKIQKDKLLSYNFWQGDENRISQDEFDLLKEILL